MKPIDLRKHATSLALKSSVLYVLGHALDLSTTYVLSPDLERETNMMVSRYGFGWSYILVTAVATSILMFALLNWTWHRLVQRFPDRWLSYDQFYRNILYGTDRAGRINKRAFATGALIGILSISAYAAITTKLLTGIWNLSVLAVGVRTDDFLVLIMIKVVLAACVGLAMFFVYPYWLHHKIYAD